jgi:uncharacterized membrane protein
MFDGKWHNFSMSVIPSATAGNVTVKLSMDGVQVALSEMSIGGQNLQSIFASGILTFYSRGEYNISFAPVGYDESATPDTDMSSINIAKTIADGKWLKKDNKALTVQNGIVKAPKTETFFKLNEQINLGDTVAFQMKMELDPSVSTPSSDWQLVFGLQDTKPGTYFWQPGPSQIAIQCTPNSGSVKTRFDIGAYNGSGVVHDYNKLAVTNMFDGAWHKFSMRVEPSDTAGNVTVKLKMDGIQVIGSDLNISGQKLQEVFKKGILTFYSRGEYNISIKPLEGAPAATGSNPITGDRYLGFYIIGILAAACILFVTKIKRKTN